jgi:FK506-binding protein 2
MLLLNWLSCLFLAATVVATEAPKNLVIDTTYTPADCTVKAGPGDEISVHYVSSILLRDSDS